MSFDMPLVVDSSGRAVDGLRETRLARAVINSLFTWARARPGDALPTPESPRMGWWGDTYAPRHGDRFGSRLWLLTRETLTSETLARARDYAGEALAWLVEDGIAVRIDVQAERRDPDRLAMAVFVDEPGGGRLELRFADIWSALHAGH